MIPIEQLDLTYEEAKKYVKNHLCICGNILTVAWGGSYGVQAHILRCGVDIKHTGITRHDPKFEKRKKEFYGDMETTALQTMDKKTMLQRIDMARFPKDLTEVEKKLLAEVALTYGLDPLMGEILIYEGRPYCSIDGRYRKAQETGKLDGVETRPATKKERADWEIPDGDYFFRSEVWVKESSRPFVGWGRVRQTETKAGSRTDTTSTYKPIQNNPQRMAEKRAEAQALRKAFHIPLPSAEDIGGGDDEKDVIIIEQPKQISQNQPDQGVVPPAGVSPSIPGQQGRKAPLKPAPVAGEKPGMPGEVILDNIPVAGEKREAQTAPKINDTAPVSVGVVVDTAQGDKEAALKKELTNRVIENAAEVVNEAIVKEAVLKVEEWDKIRDLTRQGVVTPQFVAKAFGKIIEEFREPALFETLKTISLDALIAFREKWGK